MIKIKDIKRLYERENKVSSDFGHFLARVTSVSNRVLDELARKRLLRRLVIFR